MRKEIEITRLVNQQNPLDREDMPLELVITDQNENNFHKYVDPTLKPMIDKRILPALRELQMHAKEEGFSFIVDSGYRSYNYQQQVLDSFIQKRGLDYAKKYVAPPETSEHQTGLAIDFASFQDGNYQESLTEEEIEWLQNNAYQFGFILRYPKGKESITGYNYEPWHYRYVGDLSYILYNFDITLEEYYLRKEDYDSHKGEKKKVIP